MFRFRSLFHSKTKKALSKTQKGPQRPRLELLEDRLAPATHRWLGLGADANWRTDGNWLNVELNQIQAPNSADDVLVFPNNTQRLSSVNNFPSDTTFQQIRFEGVGFNLAGNLLRLTNGIDSNGSSGVNTLSFSINITEGAMPVNVSIFDTLTLSGVIGGEGGMTKEGNGTLVLSGENRFRGDFDLFEGTVQLQNSDALGTTEGRTTVFGGNSREVRLTGGITVPEDFVLTSNTRIRGLTGPTNSLTGAIQSVGTPILEVNSGGILRVTGTGSLQGDDFAKHGTGILVLEGANGYTGTTTIAGGRLDIRHPQALGSTVGNTVVQSGAQLGVVGTGLTTPIAEPLSLSGTGISGDGAMRAVASATFTGTINLSASASIFVSSPETVTVSGVISGTSGRTLTKSGTGRLVLTGANTYLGFTTVAAGVLHVGNSSALGGQAAGTRVAAGATVEVADNPVRVGDALFLNGAGSAGAGALRAVGPNFSDWFGAITLESPSTIRVDGFELELAGAISGSAAATFTKTGIGRLDSLDPNTFAGNLLIQQGTFRINDNQGLGTSTGTTTVSSGATLAISGNRRIEDERLFLFGNGVNGIGALEVRGGDSTWGGTALDIGNITLNSANVTIGVYFGGEFRTTVRSNSSTTGLTKVGDGTLELANSTVTGPVVVNQGKLRLANADIGPTTLSNSGVLEEGSGRVQGNLTANSGSLVDGGVIVNGNVTLNAGSRYRVKMNQVGSFFSADQIRLIGSVPRTMTINNAILEVTATINPPAGTQFVIINNDTSGTTLGQFNGLPQNSTVTSTDGIPFRISYFGGVSSNDTTLTRNTPSMAEYVLMYPEEIYAGEYTYLVGKLTDMDPEQFLGLYISWGDGSEQYEYPNLDEFGYMHQYMAPGEYNVFVFWFDEAGEGNFREFTIRVLEPVA